MSDFQEQLADLRRRIARIDRKYAKPKAAQGRPPAPSPQPVEDFPWEEIETEHGRHYEAEKLYERHRRHGSIGITDLEDLPHDLLLPISNGEIPNVAPQK
jgi:hypothetical protein